MHDAELDNEEITDAQITDELFYDPDATDEDLGMFLGPSDKDLKQMYRGSTLNVPGRGKGRLSKALIHKKSVGGGGILGTIKENKLEKLSETTRKRSSDKDASSHVRRSSSMFRSQDSERDMTDSQGGSALNMRHSGDGEDR